MTRTDQINSYHVRERERMRGDQEEERKGGIERGIRTKALIYTRTVNLCTDDWKCLISYYDICYALTKIIIVNLALQHFPFVLYFVYSTANNHRVPLKNEHPDYINAVFINVMHCHYFLVS